MEKNNIKGEYNFSRQGKDSIRKYLYLLDRENHLANIDKILSAKNKDKFIEDEYFNSSNILNAKNESSEKDDILFDEDIFNKEYQNNHYELLEEQKAKYLDSRDKYKYHITHLKSKNKKINKKDSHNLLLFYDNKKSEKNINSLWKKIVYSQSFSKMIGRYDIEKKENKIKKINLNINEENNDDKKNDVISPINIGGSYVSLKNQTMKGSIPAHHDVRIRIEKRFETNKSTISPKNININNLSNLSNRESPNISSENNIINNILPYILNCKIKEKISNININNDDLNRPNYEKPLTRKIKYSPDKNNSLILSRNEDKSEIKSDYLQKHIRGISFNNMLSRVKKSAKKSEIKNICYPCSPNYSSIYPKISVRVFYDKKSAKKKNFSPKLKGMKDELIFDINKVYNKYNNHKEPKSFSLDKMLGRNKKGGYYDFLNIAEDKNNKNNKNIIKENSKEGKNKINIIKSYFNKRKISDEKIKNKNNNNSHGFIIYNDNLENAYKKLMEKNILNKEILTENDISLKRIIKGNKININYKKLLKYYNEIQMAKMK